jgi:hypothetical protein
VRRPGQGQELVRRQGLRTVTALEPGLADHDLRPGTVPEPVSQDREELLSPVLEQGIHERIEGP